MPFEYIPLIKAAVGIATAGYALTDEENRKKFMEAVFSETFGGIIADFTKDSASSLYGKLAAKYATKDGIDKNSLNHDLQKAARKAQLIAAFFAAQDCLEKVRFDNLPEIERGKLGKFFDYARTKIQGRDAVEVYLESVVKYLNGEIEKVETDFVSGNLTFEEFSAVFDIHKKAVKAETQQVYAAQLKKDVFDELKFLPKYDLNFRDDSNGFKLLETAIVKGWDDVPKTAIVSKNFVSLNIEYAKPPKRTAAVKEKGFDNDWFRLVCIVFNEEYKENANITAAAQKQILLELLGKVNKFGKLKNKTVKNLTREISKFSGDIAEIKADVKETLETSKRVETDVKELKESFNKIISPIPQTGSPKFVALPNLEDRIYGRGAEIGAIINFLETGKKHAIITAPTCFGKTSLIKKFISKNLDEKRTESLKPDLFTKIIYLDCRKYSGFEGIAQHFATLLQETLEYQTENEEHFLRHTVFPKIANEKVLIILDNFESWQSDGVYQNVEVGIFLSTVFASQSPLRLLFISWHKPHRESEFSTKVEELKFVRDKLYEGLERDAAIRLVRRESKIYGGEDSLVDLDEISEAELTAFFERVFYIPQSIQSMVHFIGRKQCTFGQFLSDYQKAFDAEQSDASELDEKRDRILRPAKALINLQISLLNPSAKDIISHIAFYGIDVPQDILILDSENVENESEQNRDELNRLAGDRLIIRSINRNDREPFALYNLHEFVRQTILNDLPDFQQNHATHLENLSDRMKEKTDSAWENKLFYKQLALSECWEKLEDFLINVLEKNERQYMRNFVDFQKALASQEIAQNFAVSLTAEQQKQFRVESKILYLDYIKKNPNHADAYNNLGILLIDLGRTEEAEASYRKAIELNPNYADAYNNLGVLLKDSGRTEEAEASYRKAIELNPNYADAYNNLGNLLKDSGRTEEAEASYRKAIELNPNYATAYNNLGVLLKDSGRTEEAEASYRKAIELNPNYANAYGNLANLQAEFYGEKIKDEIFRNLEKCVELNPAHKEWAKGFGRFDFIRDDARFAEITGEDGE